MVVKTSKGGRPKAAVGQASGNRAKAGARPARNSRARQKAATRAKLLKAGRTVFVRDGYQRASLDRVAAEAGFTKGAVYGNFATKADLLLAIYEERSVARAQAIATAAADVTSLEELRKRMVSDWRGVIEHERGWSLLLIEFWVHAAREPELRKRLREAHLRVRQAITEALAGVTERSGVTLAMPAGELATSVMALGNGLNLEAFLDEPIPDRLYETGTRLLGGAP